MIAVAVLVWLLFIRGGDDNSDGTQGPQAQKTVKLVSAAELPGTVADVDYPVYWLGGRGGVSYEVTIITDGRTYVRYLPKGVDAGSPDAYLTVASYAQANAFDVLKGLGDRPGAKTVPIPNGGLVLESKDKPSGVYAAFPGADTQIELFDPEPGNALKLAKSGDLTQVK